MNKAEFGGRSHPRQENQSPKAHRPRPLPCLATQAMKPFLAFLLMVQRFGDEVQFHVVSPKLRICKCPCTEHGVVHMYVQVGMDSCGGPKVLGTLQIWRRTNYSAVCTLGPLRTNSPTILDCPFVCQADLLYD